MPKSECKGCGLRIQFGHRKECKMTKPDVKDIKDCPCKECLIKMSCSLLCSKFIKIYKKDIGAANLWVKTEVNSPRPNDSLNMFPRILKGDRI
jgi:hypothetical protein